MNFNLVRLVKRDLIKVMSQYLHKATDYVDDGGLGIITGVFAL